MSLNIKLRISKSIIFKKCLTLKYNNNNNTIKIMNKKIHFGFGYISTLYTEQTF